MKLLPIILYLTPFLFIGHTQLGIYISICNATHYKERNNILCSFENREHQISMTLELNFFDSMQNLYLYLIQRFCIRYRVIVLKMPQNVFVSLYQILQTEQSTERCIVHRDVCIVLKVPRNLLTIHLKAAFIIPCIPLFNGILCPDMKQFT